MDQNSNIQEMSLDALSKHLDGLLHELHGLLTTIQSAFDRDNRNLTLFSLGFRASIEFERLKSWLLGPNDLLAWCVRNLYEIDLTVLRVIRSEDELKAWIGEALTDDEDITKGFQVLRQHYQPATNERDDLRQQAIARLRFEHGFAAARSPNVVSLARDVGQASEYQLFYKFLSKYIHPTSWLVNVTQERTNAESFRNLLLGMAQVITQRIRARLEAAFDLRGRTQPIGVRPIPWRPSSYDRVPHSEWRQLHAALQPTLAHYVRRWGQGLSNPSTEDVLGLESFARHEYVSQRFDWPSWPAREEHAVKLYAAVAHFREALAAAPSDDLDLEIIRRTKEDLGDTRFTAAWATGSAFDWHQAVRAAVDEAALREAP